jgi:RNA polymerase sigma factor (sigma-70 family)
LLTFSSLTNAGLGMAYLLAQCAAKLTKIFAATLVAAERGASMSMRRPNGRCRRRRGRATAAGPSTATLWNRTRCYFFLLAGHIQSEHMSDDAELMREYVERGSEEAFRALVVRHSGMVHGVAFRITRSEQLSEEITQAVFIMLVRKATKLRPDTVLAGWLHHTARFVALEAIRGERRRLEHEERMTNLEDSNDGASVWQQIVPQLDEALSRLGKTDRDAVVLRFLEQRSFAEVAAALSTTEAAAKMRVGRALEKLRSALAQCGVAVPAAALLTALSTHGVTAAPAGLTTSVTASALAQSGAGPSIAGLVKGALFVMAWNKAKIGVTATVIIGRRRYCHVAMANAKQGECPRRKCAGNHSAV